MHTEGEWNTKKRYRYVVYSENIEKYHNRIIGINKLIRFQQHKNLAIKYM
jgi:hypothetical protein